MQHEKAKIKILPLNTAWLFLHQATSCHGMKRHQFKFGKTSATYKPTGSTKYCLKSFCFQNAIKGTLLRNTCWASRKCILPDMTVNCQVLYLFGIQFSVLPFKIGRQKIEQDEHSPKQPALPKHSSHNSQFNQQNKLLRIYKSWK